LHRGRIIIPHDKCATGNLGQALAAPARDERRRERGVPEVYRDRVIHGVEPSAEPTGREGDSDPYREAALGISDQRAGTGGARGSTEVRRDAAALTISCGIFLPYLQ
jgi:hypothetical protein